MRFFLESKLLPDALRRAEDLPSPPGVALEVLRLCRDEDTTLDDLARVLAQDPALSARLLRFSNSSLYNLGQEVTSIQRACLVLGLKSVQLMSLTFSLTDVVPHGGTRNGIDYGMLWHRSVVCAVAGRMLANTAGLLCEDEAFLCGLLSHVGQMVLADCMPEEYAEVLARAGSEWPSADLERELLGFDHGDVGGALLGSWSLPEVVVTAVGAMHDVGRVRDDVAPEVGNVVRIVHLAGLTVDLMTRAEKGLYLSRIEERAQEWLGIPPEDVYEFVNCLEAGVREASELLNLELPASTDYGDILSEARLQLVLIGGRDSARGGAGAEQAAPEHRAQILADPTLRDPASGLPDLAAFQAFLAAEIDARMTGRVHRPLGVLFLEIDEFDVLARVLGGSEALLRATGDLMNDLTRAGDLPARISETRFAVIMSEASPFGLRRLADRLRQGLHACRLAFEGQPVRLTATLGGACLGNAQREGDGRALVAAAEKVLQRARAAGRDHAQIHPTLLGTRR